jgi:hypothetical protein
MVLRSPPLVRGVIVIVDRIWTTLNNKIHNLRRNYVPLQLGSRIHRGPNSAAAWPLAAGTQQAAMPVIGFMSSRSPEDSVNVVAAFRGGLGEGGLIEGKNVACPSTRALVG